MIIWTGWGILAFIILAFGATYNAIGLFIAAILIFLIGRTLNNKESDKILIDPYTGEQYLIKNRHTLFWINMEWWSAISLFFAIVSLIPF